jgi:glycosyltransferase involved in cell wall biosynthesis
VIENESEKNNYQLRLYVEKDQGMYDAINRGLVKASGEICAWLNCDEQYLPGTLAKVADYFISHPEIEVLFGDALLVGQDGTVLSYRRAVLPEQSHIRFSHLNTLSCATFFRRKVLAKTGMLNTQWRTIGDAVWVDELIKNKIKLAVYQEPLSIYTWMAGNLSNTQQATDEGHRWRTSFHSYNKVRLWHAKIRHRLTKLWHGAYRKREVEYAIYTHNQVACRTDFRKKTGWSWPDHIKKS